MQREELLHFIEIICPYARTFVENAFINNQVEIVYEIENNENKGIFIIVDEEDCTIFYTSFENENYDNDLLNLITEKVKPYLINPTNKEICFNVYGENEKIIKQVRDLGFSIDMEGFHLEYKGNYPLLKPSDLIAKTYDSSMIDNFIELFDGAYYQLNLDNNWSTTFYQDHKDGYNRKLLKLKEQELVYSFWLNDQLVGAYLIDDNYITDIAVSPIYQSQGYGQYILYHSLHTMKSKGIYNTCLRVAKSNLRAKSFYERNDFQVIAKFAEHTYLKS